MNNLIHILPSACPSRANMRAILLNLYRLEIWGGGGELKEKFDLFESLPRVAFRSYIARRLLLLSIDLFFFRPSRAHIVSIFGVELCCSFCRIFSRLRKHFRNINSLFQKYLLYFYLYYY